MPRERVIPSDVRRTLVHARGGSIVRGGSRVDALLRAAPAETINGTMVLTEQGETISQGFGLKPKRDPADGERLAKYADPRISDLEKIGPERSGEERDAFGDIRKRMADGEYDPMTCNLLQWYIAEEADSARRLRETYACVREKAAGRRARIDGSDGGHASADAEAIMACMTEGFLRLEKSIDKLAKARR